MLQKIENTSKAEVATAGARQIPGIPQVLLHSEPAGMYRSIKMSVCGVTECVQNTEARGGHERADHVKGRPSDSLNTNHVWCHQRGL